MLKYIKNIYGILSIYNHKDAINRVSKHRLLSILLFFTLFFTLLPNISFAACTTFPGDTSPNADCPDGDGYTNYWEMVYGTDPNIPNNKVDVLDGVNITWASSDTIMIDIPNNLMNVDIENSGFMAFSTGGSLSFLDSWTPTTTGTWVNNNQTGSRIAGFTGGFLRLIDYSSSGTLVSTGTYTGNSTPQGPNRLFITVNSDTDKPYIFFKIVDFELGDPGEDYERYIYLGKANVDVTPPVCSIIFSGGNHEQRIGSWIENQGWSAGGNSGTILSITGTGNDISIYTGSNLHSTYIGNFVRTFTGYVPWDMSNGIDLNTSYKDNLSGLYYARYSVLDSSSGAIYDQYLLDQIASSTSSLVPAINSKTYSSKVCLLSSSETCLSIDNKFNDKIVYLKIWDRAGNTNICSSLVSKVDKNYPSIIVNSFKDYVGNDFTLFGDGYIKTNQGFNLNTDLDDYRVNYQSNLGTPLFDNPSEGVSGFSPSNFDLSTVYYCGKNQDNCKDTLISLADTNDPDLNDYIYSATGIKSSDVFASGSGDIISKNGIFFMKDAYFASTGVIITSTGVFLDSSTGATQKEVLFSNSGTYLSTSTGFIIINTNQLGLNNLNNTGFTNIAYGTGGAKYFSGANINGISAFKIYSKTYEEGGVAPGDSFYISFRFKDRAGNEVPALKQGFTIVGRLLAKILGNVQINQENVIDDPEVQIFSQPSSIREIFTSIKNNIKDELTNSTAGSSGILVNSLSDLNSYKFNYGDENIYIVREGDIVIGDGNSGKVDLTSSGKNITIISYGGNIIINSKYLYSDNDLALIALTDPSLQETRFVEAQGNILISPNTLAIKGHLISEGSILSYANVNNGSISKVDTLFTFNARKKLFRNQLLIDGSIISYNTVGGYALRQCPDAIYGANNTCDLSQFDTDNVSSLSLIYDLHYLRMFTGGSGSTISNANDIAYLTENDIGSGHTALRSTQIFDGIKTTVGGVSFDEIGIGDYLSSVSIIKGINDGSIIDAPQIFINLSENLSGLDIYPLIIKSEIPDNDMKVFGGK